MSLWKVSFMNYHCLERSSLAAASNIHRSVTAAECLGQQRCMGAVPLVQLCGCSSSCYFSTPPPGQHPGLLSQSSYLRYTTEYMLQKYNDCGDPFRERKASARLLASTEPTFRPRSHSRFQCRVNIQHHHYRQPNRRLHWCTLTYLHTPAQDFLALRRPFVCCHIILLSVVSYPIHAASQEKREVRQDPLQQGLSVSLQDCYKYLR